MIRTIKYVAIVLIVYGACYYPYYKCCYKLKVVSVEEIPYAKSRQKPMIFVNDFGAMKTMLWYMYFPVGRIIQVSKGMDVIPGSEIFPDQKLYTVHVVN